MINFILSELVSYFDAIFSTIPGKTGEAARIFYYRLRGCKIGKGCRIARGARLICPKTITIGAGSYLGENTCLHSCPDGKIEIGNEVSFNQDCLISARGKGKIYIGDFCLIGPRCTLRSSNHIYSSLELPIKSQGSTPGTINIEKNVWLAAHVVVLPNTRIGANSIIGAGAVVSKNIDQDRIAVGVPAKVIKSR